MAKKYYAVKAGRTPGIYESWDDCKRQVMGFTSAVYKSFKTIAEAEAFMAAASNIREGDAAEDENIMKIYVDGSFDKRTGRFSYGLVIPPFGGREEYRDCKAFDDPALAEMRNVAGEINGSMAAMRYCIENGITDVLIYYDYEGIAKWALHEWKANKEGTKAYAAYYDSVKDRLNVRFCKVRGHSGDKYNDIADALAKQALGLN